jgi:hypothetical protein
MVAFASRTLLLLKRLIVSAYMFEGCQQPLVV